MKRNCREIEQRMLAILKKDSSRAILDMVGEPGISRVTAKRTLDSLVGNGKIMSFSVPLDIETKNLAITHLRILDVGRNGRGII
jgi:DNA-binding Lrp family transcriptional regulator